MFQLRQFVLDVLSRLSKSLTAESKQPTVLLFHVTVTPILVVLSSLGAPPVVDVSKMTSWFYSKSCTVQFGHCLVS